MFDYNILINIFVIYNLFLNIVFNFNFHFRERHEQRHKDNDTFECEECHKFFKNEKNLRHHSKTHHEKRTDSKVSTSTSKYQWLLVETETETPNIFVCLDILKCIQIFNFFTTQTCTYRKCDLSLYRFALLARKSRHASSVQICVFEENMDTFDKI